jgi:hypothetical protein
MKPLVKQLLVDNSHIIRKPTGHPPFYLTCSEISDSELPWTREESDDGGDNGMNMD